MTLENNRKEELIKEFGKDKNDSGATEAQIAIITERINNITNHLKTNKKDHSGRRGLVNLVSKRKRLIIYLKRINVNSYMNIIEKLNIRK